MNDIILEDDKRIIAKFESMVSKFEPSYFVSNPPPQATAYPQRQGYMPSRAEIAMHLMAACMSNKLWTRFDDIAPFAVTAADALIAELEKPR